MSFKSKVPQIRFKGFSWEWEEKKLGDFCTSFSGGTPASTNKAYYSGNIPFIGSGKINSDSVEQYITNEALEKSSAKMIEKGDLLYALYGATSGEVGISKIKGAINQAVLCLRTKENKFFLFKWLQQNKKDILSTYLQGGQGNLSAQIIKDLKPFLPNLNEQTKIGDYFQKLDKLIEQKKKKYQKLKQFKKAMLSKMFPKNGADTPEIRFKGFSGEWEEKSLKELCTLITKGTSPLDKSTNGIINFIKIENINSLSGKITITTKISKEEHENYLKRSQLKENDILFSIAGTLGRITIVQKEELPANTNQALAIIRLKEVSVSYIATYLKGKAVEDFIKKNPTVGAQPNLSLEQIGNIEILLPSINEQTKIGNYFQKLDYQIELQLQEVQKLKNIKKASLSKMFV